MNLVQQAEQIKLIPDAVLGPMQQNPTVFPPFLVLAEMQRREAMRNSSRATGDPVQQKTVAEEMREKFNPAPQMQQPAQNPQQQMAQPMPQAGMPGAPSMRLAGGGLASLLEQAPQGNGLSGLWGSMTGLGGMPPVDPAMANPQFPAAAPFGSYDDEPAITPEQLAKRFPTGSLKETKAETDALRAPNGLKEFSDLLATQEKDARGKKPKIGEILMNLGLAMAASKRPDFAGAVGEGGLAALHGYSKQRDANLERADSLMKQRMGLAEAMQRRDDQGVSDAMSAHAQKQHNRNADMQSLEASKRAQWNQRQETDRNERTQERYERVQGMRDKTAAERDDARFAATAGENRLNRESQERISQAEINARIRAANITSGNRPDHMSPILKFTATAMDDIQNAIRTQQSMIDKAESPEEKAAIRQSLEEMRRKQSSLYAVQAKELEKQYPGQGFADLFKPVQEEGVDPNAYREKLPKRGDVPKTVAPPSDIKQKAAAGMMNSLPGLQSILGWMSSPDKMHAPLPWNR